MVQSLMQEDASSWGEWRTRMRHNMDMHARIQGEWNKRVYTIDPEWSPYGTHITQKRGESDTNFENRKSVNRELDRERYSEYYFWHTTATWDEINQAYTADKVGEISEQLGFSANPHRTLHNLEGFVDLQRAVRGSVGKINFLHEKNPNV